MATSIESSEGVGISADGHPMKILWFTNTPSLGESSVGRTVFSGGWIRSLEREIQARVELSIAFYDDKGREPFTLNHTAYYPVRRDRQGAVGKAFTRLKHGLETEGEIKRLMSVVDRVKPDLIHIHGTEGPFGLLQRYTEIPVLISIQGLVTVCELKYFSGIDRSSAGRHTPLRARLVMNTYVDDYKRLAKQAVREREILHLTRFVTGRTDWDRRTTSVLAPNAKYFAVNEILRDSFYEESWRLSSRPRLELFTITSHNLYKGFETLVRCAMLLDALGFDYRWNVAGLSVQDRLTTLFQSLPSLKLSPRVRLLGTLDEAALKQQMLGSDIYVGVSHIENSPNSLCEAMLTGMPCVSTYAGGTPSILTSDQEGILVQDGDPYSMAGAITDLWKDQDKAVRMGDAARQRALKRHDPETIREAVLGIYRQVLAVDPAKL